MILYAPPRCLACGKSLLPWQGYNNVDRPSAFPGEAPVSHRIHNKRCTQAYFRGMWHGIDNERKKEDSDGLEDRDDS